jgi:sigma-B regulation protein RsbU (phosphoserine phosphatase)
MAMFRAWMGAFRLGWQPIEKIAVGINTLWSEVSSLSTFATAVFVEVNEKTGWIRSINCGHPPALVVSARGAVRELLHESSLPLGVMEDLETPIVEDALCPGDTLVLYTDGIIEARNAAAQHFELSRFRSTLGSVGHLPDLSACAGEIMDRVREFSAGAPQSDDQCLLLARIGGRGGHSC